jgi:hypothetical protein
MRALLATIVVLPALSGAARADDDPEAWLGSHQIPLATVSEYHCHDLEWPVIRCFAVEEDRDEDMGSVARRAPGEYVTFYSDDNYGGGSFTATQPYPDLAPYGWGDVITSFKSRNGGHPKFYADANYGYPSWQWSAGIWNPNVGSAANDTFSSVKNVP